MYILVDDQKKVHLMHNSNIIIVYIIMCEALPSDIVMYIYTVCLCIYLYSLRLNTALNVLALSIHSSLTISKLFTFLFEQQYFLIHGLPQAILFVDIFFKNCCDISVKI